MSVFETAVMIVLKNEGGFVDDASDRGGATNMGISLRLLQACGLKYDFDNNGVVDIREIKEITADQAKLVYKQEFWDKAPFDKINTQNVCNYIFDAAVNMGIEEAIMIAQRAVWAAETSMMLPADGKMGNQTLDEINHCGFMLLASLRAERAWAYREIARKNPKQERELKGWLNRTYERN